jgi:hypothetical protein
MNHKLKNGATEMVENAAAIAGLIWKNFVSAYSFCWELNPSVGTKTFTYTSSYPISDDFVS